MRQFSGYGSGRMLTCIGAGRGFGGVTLGEARRLVVETLQNIAEARARKVDRGGSEMTADDCRAELARLRSGVTAR
jgi:hypothetical protein